MISDNGSIQGANISPGINVDTHITVASTYDAYVRPRQELQVSGVPGSMDCHFFKYPPKQASLDPLRAQIECQSCSTSASLQYSAAKISQQQPDSYARVDLTPVNEDSSQLSNTEAAQADVRFPVTEKEMVHTSKDEEFSPSDSSESNQQVLSVTLDSREGDHRGDSQVPLTVDSDPNRVDELLPTIERLNAKCLDSSDGATRYYDYNLPRNRPSESPVLEGAFISSSTTPEMCSYSVPLERLNDTLGYLETLAQMLVHDLQCQETSDPDEDRLEGSSSLPQDIANRSGEPTSNYSVSSSWTYASNGTDPQSTQIASSQGTNSQPNSGSCGSKSKRPFSLDKENDKDDGEHPDGKRPRISEDVGSAVSKLGVQLPCFTDGCSGKDGHISELMSVVVNASRLEPATNL